MCFSAEASFTASVVLTVIGVATLRQVSSRNQLFLAVIPLLFAFQQFSEGVLWIFLQNNQNHTFWSVIARYTYLSFAFVIWPIWIPLSSLALETQPFRKKIITGLVILGSIFAVAGLFFLLRYDISANIISHHIAYKLTTPVNPLILIAGLIIYGIVITFSIMVSSKKNALPFGFIIGILLLLSLYFYLYAFTSVWCFFCAICSVIFYKVIKAEKKVIEPEQ